MDLLIQRLLDGLGNGAVYASLALAIVLIFRSTGVINFAQGEMAMICTFLAWKLTAGGGHLPVVAAVLIAMVAGLVIGGAIERILIRPVENKPDHQPVIIITIALFLAIDAVAGRVFTVQTVTMPGLFPSGALAAGSLRFDYGSLGLIGVVLVVSGAMWLLLEKTHVGLMMRATVDNPSSARLLGVNRGRILMIGWALAGMLGALAGALVAPTTLVSVTMMQGVLVYAFAAATLGGFDSPQGAVIGGLVIGVVESLCGYLGSVGNQLSLLIAFAVILIVLLVRPNGLFGHAGVERM